MKRQLWLLLLMAPAISIILATFTGASEDPDIALNRIALIEAGYPALSPESKSSVALLEEYGVEAYLAEARYPRRAIRLYSLFGDTPEFREVIHKYGYQQVVPVISHYLENGSIAFEMKEEVKSRVTQGVSLVKDLYSGLRNGEVRLPSGTASTSRTPLTSEERGWIAINRIKESGNGFLGRFAISGDGTARVLPIKTGLAIGEEFLLGGIETIERKYLSGEKISKKEMLWGAVDTAALVVGVGLFGRLAKASSATRLAARTGKVGSFGSRFGRVALGLPAFVGQRAIKWGAFACGAYVVYNYPSVITATFSAFADAIGCPRLLVCSAGWFVIILMLLAPFGIVYKILFIFLSLFSKRKR